jgi:guanine nucleotide-binding protein G(I)/G(S)/G(T) subunit beta-1
MIVWNAVTNHKIQLISLKSIWVMTCTYERSTNQFVACGGLDNVCSIYSMAPGTSRPRVRGSAVLLQVYRLSSTAHIPPVQVELHGHDGYVSCCKFVEDTHMLTSSGDGTCIYWDLEHATELCRFTDHGGDVMSVAVDPTNPFLFVSGSTDATAKAWDLRTGKCTQTFIGHESDINCVQVCAREGVVAGFFFAERVWELHLLSHCIVTVHASRQCLRHGE